MAHSKAPAAQKNAGAAKLLQDFLGAPRQRTALKPQHPPELRARYRGAARTRRRQRRSRNCRSTRCAASSRNCTRAGSTAARSRACCRRGAASTAISRAITATRTIPASGCARPRPRSRCRTRCRPTRPARLMDIPDDDALAMRDKAIFELFYSSGLRLVRTHGSRAGRHQFQRCDGARDRQGRQDARRAGRQPRARGAQDMAAQARAAGQGRRPTRCSSIATARA